MKIKYVFSPYALNIFLIIFNLFAFKLVNGQQASLDSCTYKSYFVKNDTLIVKTTSGKVQVAFYNKKMVEIKRMPDLPVADSSVAVIMVPQNVKTSIYEGNNNLIFSSDSLQVIINKVPFFISFQYHNNILLNESPVSNKNENKLLAFEINKNEKFYGLGERAVKKLRGNKFQLLNQAHYGYEIGAPNLNFSIPVLLSSKKYLLFYDNHEKGFADLGKTDTGRLSFGSVGGLVKYIFIAGSNFKDIYESYGKLTGTQPLPPRWALGNLQSRMAYRTQKEADSIVRLMQKEDFPIDALILDFYWFGDSIKGYLGRLDWYKPHWPDPEKMISGFKKKGVKTILITEPYIIDTLKNFYIANRLKLFATDSLGKTFINTHFYFGPAGLLDIFKPATDTWFWSKYNKQIKIGVAGWWGDLGEPETISVHQYFVSGKANQVRNLYAFYWEKMLFDEYRKNYPETRVFDLNRAGYAGSQRFSVFPWTGDISRSWGGLQAQLPLLLNMSVSGMPFVHSDAGGFAMGVKDNELYTRWLQFACFSPILRPHGSGIPSEPVFFNDTTKRIVREYMKIRYRLLPYIYTTVWESHNKGIPIVRPLFFEFPNDSVSYSIVDEYMFGPDFLVAPVLNPGVKIRTVYLPKGLWYDFWTGKKYHGGNMIDFPVKEEIMPVFVRAGAFIPMVKAVNSTVDYSSNEMTVVYFPLPGKSSQSYMYEDDGKTFGSFQKGEYQLLKFQIINGKKMIFSSSGKGYLGAPSKRLIHLLIIGKNKSKSTFYLKNNKKKIIRKKLGLGLSAEFIF